MPSFPRTDLGPLTRRSALAALGLTGAAIGLAACTGGKGPSGTSPSGGQSPDAPPPKAKVAITEPVAAATDVPASAEIVFTATDAVSTQVVLKDAAGADVPGEMHPDGRGWLPAKALAYGTAYTVTVTATGDDGRPATATSTFTTMAQPDKTVRVVSFLPDGAVVGVGMPLIFRISRKIPQGQRAALQRRLLVQTTPVQEGIWTWYTDDELHWRPREFWQAGTKVFVDVRAGGLPLGDGFFGARNSTLTCSIGRSLTMTIDDKAKPKVMKVVKDGVTVRTIKVSLGRASMPSSSGTTVIIERLAKTVFDTTSDPNPNNRYRTNIVYAQRLTWGGEFIHAAPWSVKDQGVRNVSHGCVNMSTADAKWLFEQTMIGDPVITKGTPRKLQYGNGWTDFDKPWDEYVKGSAIPYEPSPDASPPPDASPSPAA
ncbi:Ig-like domain-containing protein [Catellatospora aurea]|uniref:Ig-like domain-containing protein n=1 Tax=Catellatospora aurea TaxID=1337874 RepID=A0ABW2GPV0_9ACTN